MRVLDLPDHDRPRERLLRQGASALSDRELLALLLGAGLPGCDAIELAAGMIAERGSVAALAVCDPHVLRRAPGVGPAKAARVAAAFELARRAAVGAGEQWRISGSADIATVCAPYVRGLRHERVLVVVCDRAGNLLKVAPLTEGSSDRSLVPVREVLSAVLTLGGARFAVAHNHPSGGLEPSAADVRVTAQLRDAAPTVGLEFLDHLVLSETAWARVP
jgi:DNA repair protein RadC